ncbi:hypothetical protein K474DRAFT_489400 [Panus rudis PR-1116 ss-1]|nr:hypothetical protein K474DRAFT_489400 [Panus rudis PR-1116 ss-1]
MTCRCGSKPQCSYSPVTGLPSNISSISSILNNDADILSPSQFSNLRPREQPEGVLARSRSSNNRRATHRGRYRYLPGTPFLNSKHLQFITHYIIGTRSSIASRDLVTFRLVIISRRQFRDVILDKKAGACSGRVVGLMNPVDPSGPWTTRGKGYVEGSRSEAQLPWPEA